MISMLDIKLEKIPIELEKIDVELDMIDNIELCEIDIDFSLNI